MASRLIAGWLIFAMMCFSVLADVGPVSVSDVLYLLAGVAAWLAALLLVAQISRFQLMQAGAIGCVGLILMWLASQSGSDSGLVSALSKNTGLITMIASVGFLRLVALSDNTALELPVGPAA